ncbi:MAG: hypothetical protein NTW16_04660 [Bacteroidetes bacterium]|nr:hypothetical protein [Bacteroidota bacterium]
MGIPEQFNDIIRRHLNVNAAWLPIVNNYALGDYGIFSDGVFVKMGNIKEFNVSFTEATCPEASIDFTSANTTVVKTAAGVEVDVIPAAAVDAKITFRFESGKSFLVKAPVITGTMIANVNQVATLLRNSKNWERKWKVVYQVYNALDPIIVSTIAAGTELTFSGDVEALKNLKVGTASVEIGTNKELGLNIHGKSGIIGLGLFKLKLFGSGPSFLLAGDKKTPAEVEILDNSVAVDNDL